MTRQIGLFFSFIGVILLVIFFTSDQTENTVWGYFIAGAALVILGGALIFHNPRSDSESHRFKAYRKLRNRPRRPK